MEFEKEFMSALFLAFNGEARDLAPHPEKSQLPLVGTCCISSGTMLGRPLVLSQLILPTTDKQLHQIHQRRSQNNKCGRGI